MKLYVLPVESACTANCAYCITKYRKYPNSLLKFAELEKILSENRFDKIEITGGGEPSLHPKIKDIIQSCCQVTPTQIYTNGNLVLGELPQNLISVCLSRAHYDDTENERIMGVRYDMEKFAGLPVKLSLMMHKSGVSTEDETIKYLNWAKKHAQKVVIRQLFEYEDDGYSDFYKREFVPTIGLFENSNFVFERLENGNRTFDFDGLEVEIEERACACENDNPVLHATGELAKGWD